MKTHVVKIEFEESVCSKEIPFLRGCMIRLSGGNDLFHNHSETGFRYSYPLIQYKIINRRAAIIGINQGGEALKQMFSMLKALPCQLGNKPTELHVASVTEEEMTVEQTEDSHCYYIRNWLPLNSHNYVEFMHAEGLIEQIALLENILIGNILSFAKCIGVFFENPLICRIEQLEDCGMETYKGVNLMNFSARFRANVRLPQWIGIGKSSSINHGIISYKS